MDARSSFQTHPIRRRKDLQSVQTRNAEAAEAATAAIPPREEEDTRLAVSGDQRLAAAACDSESRRRTRWDRTWQRSLELDEEAGGRIFAGAGAAGSRSSADASSSAAAVVVAFGSAAAAGCGCGAGGTEDGCWTVEAVEEGGRGCCCCCTEVCSSDDGHLGSIHEALEEEAMHGPAFDLSLMRTAIAAAARSRAQMKRKKKSLLLQVRCYWRPESSSIGLHPPY